MALAKFQIFTSSTISDLAKDEILVPGIEKMAEKAKGNLTIFLNHEYRVPEDVLGSVEDTSMHTRGVDSDGNPIVDLDFDIRLNESNPRAVQTFEAIKSGVKLGTSIGAIVRSAEKKKGGGLRISDLELLEASIVGIPANPRSWVQYAVKSINSLDAAESSSFLVDEESVIKEAEDIIDTIAAEQEMIGHEIPEGATATLTVNKDGTAEVSIEKAPSMADGSGGAMASCPDCHKGHGAKGCDNDFHKSTEPDVAEVDVDKEAARTRVTVTVDSDGTQEAPKSTPEHGLMDEDRADDAKEPDSDYLADNITVGTEPDVLKAEEVIVETSEEEKLSQLFQTADFAAVVTKLQSVVSELTEKELELRKTTVERDEAKENLIVAKEIIDRIADLPIGRKTKFSGAVDDFRKKFPQYDEEFMKFLEK
jgi:HK97 family phage prohead protease